MKKTRQSKILELILKYEIENQNELAKYLYEAGVPSTQATLSRDIRELSLVKVPGENGRPKYALSEYNSTPKVEYSGKYDTVLKEGLVSVLPADNIVVVKTVSGMAMAVATAIDALDIEEIVGSIAGDDTIMCAVRSADDVPSVIKKIKERV